MTKRRLLRCSLILAVVAAFAVWLEPTRVVWGWLRGEAFYQGRPTAYWRNELAQWKCVGGFGGVLTWNWMYERENSTIENLLSRLVELPEKPWPTLLNGDSAGREVLLALGRDSHPRIRNMAEEGLERIESTERKSREQAEEAARQSSAAASWFTLVIPVPLPTAPTCNSLVATAMLGAE